MVHQFRLKLTRACIHMHFYPYDARDLDQLLMQSQIPRNRCDSLANIATVGSKESAGIKKADDTP